MRRMGRLVAPAALVVAVLALAAPAAASWVLGSGVAESAAAGTTVAPPTAPTSAVTASSVTLSWTPPAAGATPSGYSVQRTAPSSAPVCTAIVTTTCTDSGRSPGTTYTYAITSLSGLWVSSALTATATTTAPLPSAFVVVAPATANAGTQFSVTIQARQSDGSNDTSYTGSKTLSFGGPGTVGSYAPTYPVSVSFVNGFANNVKVTLFKAEITTITVADPGAPARTGVSNAVTVAAGAGSALRWTTDAAGLIDACPTGTVVVGPNGQRSWYVAVLDTYGNRAVQGASALTLTISRLGGGGPNAGSMPTPTSLTVNAGANPAVTSGTTTMKLKKKTPQATGYKAASGALSVTCTLSP
jgi:hypothetical protein